MLRIVCACRIAEREDDLLIVLFILTYQAFVAFLKILVAILVVSKLTCVGGSVSVSATGIDHKYGTILVSLYYGLVCRVQMSILFSVLLLFFHFQDENY